MCEPPDPATVIDDVAGTLNISADRLMDAADSVHARGDDLRQIAVRLRSIAGEVRSASRPPAAMPVTRMRTPSLGRRMRRQE